MIFPMLAFVTIMASAVFWLLGITPPDGSLFGYLFSSGSPEKVLEEVLKGLWKSVDVFGDLFGALTNIVAGGAIAAGIYFNRDEPLYGGLGVLLFKMLGLYSILTYSQLPAGWDNLLIVIVGLFNTVFVISFINWIRGKGE